MKKMMKKIDAGVMIKTDERLHTLFLFDHITTTTITIPKENKSNRSITRSCFIYSNMETKKRKKE